MDRYTIVLTPEPDGTAYSVQVPSLPGCFTWGSTIEEALQYAREAIDLYLEDEDISQFPPRSPEDPKFIILPASASQMD